MLWFFDRRNEYLRIETSLDKAPGVFKLKAEFADGTEQVEEFTTGDECQQKLKALERQLRADDGKVRQIQPMAASNGVGKRH